MHLVTDERSLLAAWAVAATLLLGSEAATAQSVPGAGTCVLAGARVDPTTFARARARHTEILQDCSLQPTATQAPGDVSSVPTPATVRIDPPVEPEIAPANAPVPGTGSGDARSSTEPPAAVEPGRATPAAGRAGPAVKSPGRAFNERMRALHAQVEAVGRRNDIDPLLLHALIHVESRHRLDAVSPAGARGAMQLMPQTAARFGVHHPGHLHDAGFNLAAGAAYLKMLQAEFGGDLDLALAAYNAGEGAVRRYGGRIPPFPETQAYVRDVRAMHERLRAERDRDAGTAAADARVPLAMTEAVR
jgi:soluble lytic murein transglycosylase-like protein